MESKIALHCDVLPHYQLSVASDRTEELVFHLSPCHLAPFYVLIAPVCYSGEGGCCCWKVVD